MSELNYNFPNVSRHVYDIDAFQILDDLRLRCQNNVDTFPENNINLENISFEEMELVKLFSDKEGIDITQNAKYRNLIIYSKSNIYNNYLGYKLLTIDKYKIGPLLSYQSLLFQGNDYASAGNFIGLVEFLVYDFVKSRIYSFEEVRLKKIMDWVERNSLDLITKAYTKKSNKSLPNPESISDKIIAMDPAFAKIFCEKFEIHIDKSQKKLLWDLIFDESSKEKICFQGNINQVVELFKRLRYNSKLKVRTLKLLTDWILVNFCVKVDDEILELNRETITQILSKTNLEPAKGNRILEELGAFIPKNMRKKVDS
ncbi:MAG: hypothetical protein PSX81_11335 [bacterium]|nr:hypothetical protein [bacterium]